MGRQIRRVPPNWEHPKVEKYNPFSGQVEERFQPMFDQQYEFAASKWKKNFKKFYKKGLDKEKDCEFWEYDGSPPDRDYYRPYKDNEATWFQLYETVSEGTPVSPPFATKEELADYLAEHGDFWDQDRRKTGKSPINCEPWGKAAAYKFVFGSGWMPSMAISNGQILTGGVLAAWETE